MNGLSKTDEEAMCELAAEMSYGEAAKFIAAQMGCYLSMAAGFARAVARDFPESRLAESVRAVDAASAA